MSIKNVGCLNSKLKKTNHYNLIEHNNNKNNTILLIVN